jgi:hypothetical protein
MTISPEISFKAAIAPAIIPSKSAILPESTFQTIFYRILLSVDFGLLKTNYKQTSNYSRPAK